MNIIEKSFKLLYPKKEFYFESSLKYSGKFKGYNAAVRYSKKKLDFRLSKKWKAISEEIKIGLIQSLMVKVFKNKRKTTNIDLYNIFLKKVHLVIKKTKSHPVLDKSFSRINEIYFNGVIEKPNFILSRGKQKLGSYEYGTDTISINKAILNDKELLDYVMFHEMLHKKYKFSNKNGRNYHHTKEFRSREKEFPNANKIEERLKKTKLL